MTRIPPIQMAAFTGELTKIGGPVSGFVTKHLAGRYGRQLAVGAGLGGVGNVLRHRITDTPEERAQSSTLGQFVRGGLAGGAAAGGRILATQEGRKRLGTAVKNVFDKERYGITGRGLGKTPEEQLARAQEIGIVSKKPTAKGVLGYETGPMRPQEAEAWRAAQKAHARDVSAFQGDLHSAPGVAHGMLSRPVHTLRETVGRRWQEGGVPGKLFMGLGAAGAAKGFLETPEEGGPGRFEKGLRGLGTTLGYAAGPAGWIGSALTGGAGGAVGGGLGKTIDALSGRGRVVPQQEYAGPYGQMTSNVG